MKKFIIFSFILISFLSCDNDPTPPLPPTVTTGDVTNIGNSSASISVSSSEYNPKEIGVLYGTTPTVTLANAHKVQTSSYNNIAYLAGLSASTVYYYKAYATNGTDYTYGATSSFFTTNSTAKVVTGTGSSTGYYSTYYHFSLNTYAWGLDQISEWGNQVSSTALFTNSAIYSVSVANYVEGTAYSQGWQTKYTGIEYYRAYAKLKSGIYIYGEIKSVNVTY